MKQKETQAYKHPRAGEKTRACIFCGRNSAIIRRYGLCICRQCFREKASSLGFEKYN